MHLRTSATTARALLAIFVALTLVLGVGLVSAGASAQELPGSNETTAEPDETIVQDQLGDLTVHDYSYTSENETMTIDMSWSGNLPETVTLTEMLELDSAGSTKISFKTVRLKPGDRVSVQIAAEESSGTAAVLITTEQSVQNNDALVIQSGDGVERGPVPFNWTAGFVGLAAVGGAGVAYGLSARNYLNADDDEPEVERIA